MIISEQEFLSNLYIIQTQNPPSHVLFPGTKQYYNIDLKTREVQAPEYLSISKDHQSETFYFKIKRFHDYMDLANTTCIIQYNIPNGDTYLYRVPFYDLVTESKSNCMVFPWCIDQSVTQYSGIVQFSIRFYITEQKIEKEVIVDEEGNETLKDKAVYYLLYNLTTLPAESKVLDGMEVSDLKSKYDIPTDQYEALWDELTKIKAERAVGTYWMIET